MNELQKRIQQARPGQIIPIVREIDIRCPVEYFARLTDYGRRKHSCLFESRDYLSGSGAGELTFATAQPALYLTGKGTHFRIEALTPAGKRILRYLASNPRRFSFCDQISFEQERIVGTFRQSQETLDEQSRLKSTNQMDVIRAVAFAFELASKPFRITCGLLGALSYDFIDQFEKLPASSSDILENPDYELYFADNIFLMDHKKGQGFVVVNAVVTNGDRDQIYQEAMDTFDFYTDKIHEEMPQPKPCTTPLPGPGSDTSQQDYENMVLKAKQHILDGDIFQVVLSRTHIEPCPAEALDVYRKLRKLNPSPYMFYLNTDNTILMGASPELNLRVGGSSERVVEIRPIAGTKPRGRVNNKIDSDMDMRYEAELKLDRKELAEHMMLVDLARNDIARVSNRQ